MKISAMTADFCRWGILSHPPERRDGALFGKSPVEVQTHMGDLL